ncbi:hypothetical protein G3R49_01930 [Shewanella sp. WXL01]|uniref:Outer membrane protein assembly factor BamE n=1 Tax=Shewanella maritima TaxID=2520507 RepID=A0A411PG19_9GAMM|nr:MULTISPECIES: hypothetical protein [Shewanella]NKF49339.1 hypothetical protein [Shewanella sp. WXL01]QBF82537.1 hypothetical protein EXU30_07385 [Shewanella maritima]
MKIKALSTALLSMVLATACQSTDSHHTTIDKTKIAALELGKVNAEKVIQLVGQPAKIAINPDDTKVFKYHTAPNQESYLMFTEDGMLDKIVFEEAH